MSAPSLAVLRAVQYADAIARGDFSHATPRRDVIGRAVAAGFLVTESRYVHSGSTSRSRQRVEIASMWVTKAGRKLIEAAR